MLIISKTGSSSELSVNLSNFDKTTLQLAVVYVINNIKYILIRH